MTGFAPGGATDRVARIVGDKLQAKLGITVLVDNRTGGVGTVAGSMVVKSAPDGHTLLQTAGFSISAALHQPNARCWS